MNEFACGDGGVCTGVEVKDVALWLVFGKGGIADVNRRARRSADDAQG